MPIITVDVKTEHSESLLNDVPQSGSLVEVDHDQIKMLLENNFI